MAVTGAKTKREVVELGLRPPAGHHHPQAA